MECRCHRDKAAEGLRRPRQAGPTVKGTHCLTRQHVQSRDLGVTQPGRQGPGSLSEGVCWPGLSSKSHTAAALRGPGITSGLTRGRQVCGFLCPLPERSPSCLMGPSEDTVWPSLQHKNGLLSEPEQARPLNAVGLPEQGGGRMLSGWVGAVPTQSIPGSQTPSLPSCLINMGHHTQTLGMPVPHGHCHPRWTPARFPLIQLLCIPGFGFKVWAGASIGCREAGKKGLDSFWGQ